MSDLTVFKSFCTGRLLFVCIFDGSQMRFSQESFLYIYKCSCYRVFPFLFNFLRSGRCGPSLPHVTV